MLVLRTVQSAMAARNRMSALRSANIFWPGGRRLVQEARSAADDQEPGHVRDRGRRGADHRRLIFHRGRPSRSALSLQIALWLWFTVLFANFAEAVAEGRGKAQADALRKTRKDHRAPPAHDGSAKQDVPARNIAERATSSSSRAGEIIPADGEVIEGIATRGRIGHHRRIRAGHPRKPAATAAPSPAARAVLVDRS